MECKDSTEDSISEIFSCEQELGLSSSLSSDGALIVFIASHLLYV